MRAVLLVLVGCGRLSFDAVIPADGTQSMIDASADAAGAFCAQGLVGHWPLDEVAGSTIDNVAGGPDGTWADTNDDTVVGETTTGQRGGALQFATGRYISVPGFVVPSEGTASVWLLSAFDDSMAPVGGSHAMVIDAPTPRTTISFADSGVYTLRTNDVSWQAELTPPGDLTAWFHLTATWSATSAQLYLNGTPMGVAGTADARSTSPAPLYVGTREALDRWWDGAIDDLRIYDYAMSPAEVTALMGCP